MTIGDTVIKWIVGYFWDEAIGTLKVTIAITVFVIVFTLLNSAGCMISSLDLENRVKEGINNGFIIVDFMLIAISLAHTCTAMIKAIRGK